MTLRRSLLAAVLAVACHAVLGAQQAMEEFARRQYDSGVTFMQNGRYTEALKDFQAILESFTKSAVADDALLQMALYQLEIAREPAASQAAIDRLLKEYPDTDSAPMAHVVAGRVALAKGRAQGNVDAALASFERVPRLFPNDEVVPAAGFYAADTLRIVRRTDEALDRFRRVSMEYPRSVWAARARLGAGLCLVGLERAPRALEELQRIRVLLPNSPEAAEALSLNTILYRLYVRLPAQPAFAFSGRHPGTDATKLKDIVGIRVGPGGQLFVAHKQGVSVFDTNGKLARVVPADDPSAFFLDERGRIILARKDTLIVEKAQTIPVRTPGQEKPRVVEGIPAAIALSNGDRLVADHKAKQVIRLNPAGEYSGKFAGVDASQLALNIVDDVAMIDRESKGIVIVDRDGQPLSRIAAKGTGYEFDNPVDLMFDPFGHVYVLDRGRSSVYVFGPKNKLLTVFTIPEKTAGAFQRPSAFALDRAGRLLIFDDKAQTIQVYQ